MTAARLEAAIAAALAADPRRPAAAIAREVLEVLGWPASRLRSVRRAVANLAKQATRTGTTLDVGGGEMSRGTRGLATAADDIAVLVGRDVEARCTGGGCFRGVLQAVGDDFLRIERSTTARAVYVRRSGLVALVDETPVGLQAAGRRAADAALDRSEAE